MIGSPVACAYIGSNVTQITAGITISPDHDGVVGLNCIYVVASSGNGFATNTTVSLVFTAGTVDGISVAGRKIGSFTIEKSAAALNIGAAGAGLTAIPGGGTVVRTGTAQAGGTNAITLDAGASAVNDLYRGAEIYIKSGTGAGQTRGITAYNGTTKVATVGAWAVNPDNTSVWDIYPTEGGLRAFYTDISTVIATLGTAISQIPTANANATATWDHLVTATLTTGSMGKRVVDYLTGNIFGLLGTTATGSIGGDLLAIQTGVTSANTRVMLALPNAAGGAANGLMILGANAANPTVNINGSVASVVGSAGSVIGAVGSVNDRSGFTLASAAYDSFFMRADAIEVGETYQQTMRLFRSVLNGVSAETSGTVAFKRKDGSTTAFTAVHSSTGSRTAVTVGTV